MINDLKPLFKWTGSKRKMFSKYAPLFEGLLFDNFVDLCGGTGITSVWINKNFPHAHITLNEYNVDIYQIYEQIKYNYDEFIDMVNYAERQYMAMESKELRKVFYLTHREFYHNNYYTLDTAKKAACLFFLMSTNFNGIWQARVSTGIYYTPFGNGGEKTGIYNRKAMSDFRDMVVNATISCGSYEEVIIPQNALIFADPPYVNSHTQYDRRASFEDIMQLQMAEYLKNAPSGSKFAFCNKDHTMFDEVFKGYNFEYFDVKYTASSKDTAGAKAKEVLIHNFTKGE